MGRKMTPHERPKRFGSSDSWAEGWQARIRGMTEDKNPYRQGTDDYKRWKEGYRKAGKSANISRSTAAQ